MPIRPEGIPLGKDSPKESFGPLDWHGSNLNLPFRKSPENLCKKKN